MVIMLLLGGLGMFGSSGWKFSSSSSRPKRDNTLLMLGISLVLIPGVTIGGALIAVGVGVYFAGKVIEKVVDTVGTIAIKTVASPYYLMRWIFKKTEHSKQLTQEVQKHVLTQEDVKEFNTQLKKSISEDPQTIYVTVNHIDSSQKTLDKMVMALEKEDTVATVLLLCKKKWAVKQQVQSMQLFAKNKIVLCNTLVSHLDRNHLGVVELNLVKMETY